ncbi:MAG: hypothetical protein OEZ55_09455 [Nitrospinota bacterium]|nr:hypothetical protein [Nitrospinota bacterium]MDH5756881.1 hypothetical protein [Nitrospinota bacterium]
MYEALSIIFGVIGFILAVAVVINSFVTKKRKLMAKTREKDENPGKAQ